jgi:hypothetical protein
MLGSSRITERVAPVPSHHREEVLPVLSKTQLMTHTCPTCGHVLGVAGLGRHRVYFEISNERLDDPVMDRVCPGCRVSLPGK